MAVFFAVASWQGGGARGRDPKRGFLGGIRAYTMRQNTGQNILRFTMSNTSVVNTFC